MQEVAVKMMAGIEGEAKARNAIEAVLGWYLPLDEGGEVVHIVGGGHDGRIGSWRRLARGGTTMAIEAVRSDGRLEAEKDGGRWLLIGLRWRCRGKRAGESRNKKGWRKCQSKSELRQGERR